MNSPSPLAVRHYRHIDQLVPRHRNEFEDDEDNPVLARSLFDELREPMPEDPRLVSSAHGALEAMLLSMPTYAVEAPPGEQNPLGAVHRDLLKKLPASCHFVVLTHQAVRGVVEGWLAEAAARERTTLLVLPDHLNISVWAEDAYAIVQDRKTGARFFIEPFEFPRYADALIADFVCNKTATFRHTQAPLYFQGGNMLIGDDFFMIGADYPAKSLRYMGRVLNREQGEKPAATIKRLYKQYLDQGRELLYIGSALPVPKQVDRKITLNGEEWTETVYYGNKRGTVQPLFHIDMFMTLAGRDAEGKYQIVVGDPRMAAELLGVPVWPHALVEVFDDIARGLERAGFRVHRSPLPLVYVDEPEVRMRTWYFATSNNALVEVTRDSKRIWIPTYGYGAWESLSATDAANKRLWESLGFEVIQLVDCHPFAGYNGVVHCIKKYLVRGEG